jgi:hypothetical protein
MELTSAQKLARMLLLTYGHEGTFTVSFMDQPHTNDVKDALVELGCEVEQTGNTLSVACADK